MSRKWYNRTYLDDYYDQAGYRDDPSYCYCDKGGQGGREVFWEDWFGYIVEYNDDSFDCLSDNNLY